MGNSETIQRMEISCSLAGGGSRVTKHGQESPKVSIHSPFDEHVLRRYISPLDCAVGAQSRPNQI
jgi:hypothetical protein